MPRAIDKPSPNFDDRPSGQAVDILLLHYTGMPSAEAALARLCDPAAKVSAHYCIDEDGTLYTLVPEAKRAWHAGASHWAGAVDVNARSIGIELVNPGHEFGYRPFAEPQMASLIALCRAILARHPIPPERVLGHSDVAPRRKADPGELFDWARLAAAGIGLWPDEAPAAPAPADLATVQAGLARFGYAVPRHGRLDEETRAVLRAFQRHFRPEAVTGEPDAATAARLEALLARLDAERTRA
ncbi:MAG TPA: N-acetylmuramoyl-L-alanine amidase [Kiloniellales bacterium]|nr:N-acetylmuramoyl-L-alanine amidase [Kiloniellales bacterium]